jgi:hypothetical protein
LSIWIRPSNDANPDRHTQQEPCDVLSTSIWRDAPLFLGRNYASSEECFDLCQSGRNLGSNFGIMRSDL